ncbi:MAG: thioredoxin [Phycisphaerae bacterium]|jgi:thioredoxin 1|nr:thioredoxin [Phycisphaerae bacterium]
MAAENVLELTDENFEAEVTNSGLSVLVDFGAEWCMPCKMLAPIIEEIAADYAGKIKVGNVDTDSSRETSIKFNISSIPTVILFKDGQMAKKLVGLQKKVDLTAAIDELLG